MRLAIHYGDTLDRELTLATCDLRIGRGEENDIVLPDRSQTVSRVHGKLQYEGGRYVLTDQDSSNGIWVGDCRVSTIPLQPGEPVTLGPYTLVLHSDLCQLREPTAQRLERTSGWTDTRAAIQQQSYRGAPSKAANNGGQLVESVPGFIAYLARLRRPILFGAFAVCMIGAMAIGQIFVPARRGQGTILAGAQPRKAAHSGHAEVVQEHLAEAKRLVDRHEFDDGITQLDQVLFVEPLNAEALELKMRAKEMKAAGSPSRSIGPAKRNAQTAALGAENADTVPSELMGAPESSRKSTPAADDGTRAANGVDSSVDRAGRIPRPQPQIAKRPGKDQAAERERDREVKERYDRAKADLERGAFQTAVVLFGEIERDQPNYKDVSMLLAQARDGQRAMVQQALEQAKKLEAAGDLPGAFQRYTAAQQLDSSRASVIEESMQRVGGRMRSEGADAIARAKRYDAYGRIPEAIASYERAYQYLPDSDPSKTHAKDRLDVLRARQ